MTDDQAVKPSIMGDKRSLRAAFVGPAIVGAMILVRMGLPALFDKGHRFDDFVHGDALPLAVGTALLYLICTIGHWLIVRRAASHDPVRTRRVGCSVIAAIVVLLAEAYFVVPDVRDYRLASYLVAHGVPAQAQFVRSYTRGCGKAACSDAIRYRFTPMGSDRAVEGSVEILSGRARGRHDEIDYVELTGTVPILYDPRAPDRAMFFWKDDVARSATIGGSFVGVIALNIIALIVAVPLALIIRRDLARQRRAGAVTVDPA